MRAGGLLLCRDFSGLGLDAQATCRILRGHVRSVTSLLMVAWMMRLLMVGRLSFSVEWPRCRRRWASVNGILVLAPSALKMLLFMAKLRLMIVIWVREIVRILLPT